MYNPYQGFQPQQTGYGFQQPQQPPTNGFQQQQPGPQPGYYSPMGQQPPQQQQPQQTGFYSQMPQQQLYPSQTFQPAPQMPQMTQPLQSQPTGYLVTQPTGFAGAPSVVENVDLKIPAMRLSFITAEDQKKFEHLFRTAVPKGESTISGELALNIMLRSGLTPVTLADIWSLLDFSKLGSLLFPEFALALHLCSIAKRGESVPRVVPERWANEVRSFIDAIALTVPDDPLVKLANTPFAQFAPPKPDPNDWMNTGMPQQQYQPTGFGGQQAFGGGSIAPQRTGGGSLVPVPPQRTGGLIPVQKTGPLVAQGTGYQPLQSQGTGFNGFQPQGTGFQPQLQAQGTGFQAQGTGYQPQLQAQGTGFNKPLQAQGTGYQPLAPLQAQGTGYQPLQAQGTGYQPLQAQGTGYLQPQSTGYLQAMPTGKPGQWGFVNTPTGGIPGLGAMQLHFLPNAPTGNLQQAMGTNQTQQLNIPWAITKQEKQIYDGIFAAWDNRKGYIQGEDALKIFGKLGLARPDLESIWNLADTLDRGKLNKDEFAVAMHLVYRRLNGHDIPLRLPPELVPPSNKNF